MRIALLHGLGLLVLLFLCGALAWGWRRSRRHRQGMQATDTSTAALVADAVTVPHPGAQAEAATAHDAFWAGVGAAPVEAGGSGLAFTATFAPWADAFNEQVQAHWSTYPNDHVGHTGTQALYELYKLTPAKVEQLWRFAQHSGLDPRLLLAMLAQEGTGSFNTNPENAGYYGSNGPQPDWCQDLALLPRTLIPAKLRLYPHAVQGGFTASWIDYVNWYTPIDKAAYMGAAGAYAADIHWGDSVKAAFRKAAHAVGSTQDDPVSAYGMWLVRHVERFGPQFVRRPFTVREGLAAGDRRPTLAQSPAYGKPDYPGTYLADGWWWFPAPDRFCWHIVH